MYYFVKLDQMGFVSELHKEPGEGLTRAYVPLTWIDNFVKYFDKYRYSDGALQEPGNLPELSLSVLASNVNSLSAALQTSQEENTKLKATVSYLSNLITEKNGGTTHANV